MFKPITLYFFLSSLIIFSFLMLVFVVKLKLQVYIAYAVAINFTLFFLYLYDKISAKFSRLRIPELILHLYTLLGGTPMAFLAQKILSHKSTKPNFQSTFKKIVFIQLLVALSFAGFVIYSA